MASMASTRTACETSSADLSAGSKSITTASTSCSACRRSMATDHPGLAHQPVELVIGNIVQASVLRRTEQTLSVLSDRQRTWRNTLSLLRPTAVVDRHPEEPASFDRHPSS